MKFFRQTYFYSLFLLLYSFHAHTQSIGNEWINYNQTYFKVKITQKGIYQLSFSDLKSGGFPTNINPEKIQLFRQGKEQAIFVKGQEDKRLDEDDFIEFYAEGNDGSLDSLLYIPSSSQPHSYYSLYTDTASYFLTYYLNNQIGKRAKIIQNSNNQNLKPDVFHAEEVLQLFTNSYAEGQPKPIGVPLNSGVLYSDYTFGKGWTGDVQSKNNFINFDFNLKNFIKSTPYKPTLEYLVHGRSAGGHNVQIWLGEGTQQVLLDTLVFDNYFTKKKNIIVNFPENVANRIQLSTRSVGNQSDQYSVSYLLLKYPQSFDMAGLSQKVFNLIPSPATEHFISIPNAPTNVQLYDISDKSNLQKINFSQNGNSVEAVVSGNKILATNQFKRVSSIEPVAFRNLNNSKANYLIISHKSLQKNIKEYTSYRASSVGGKYDTLAVDVDLLYNLFTFGDKNPLAIRRFLNLMYRNGNPQFVFLIGTSSYPQKARKNMADYQIDLVPSVGYPGADMPFTMGLGNTQPNFVNLSIGRLATDNPETILHYLNKVKEHEATPMDALWRKKSLKMSGGRSIFELSTFKNYITDFKNVFEQGSLGGKADLVTKKTDNPVEFINVTERVNQGLGMLTLFGHSSPGQTDMDIGYCSNELLGYQNKGKYPLVFVNGCDAGDLFATRFSFGTDWINTPNKGAILFLAHSNLGYPSYLKSYSDELYNTQLMDSVWADKPFGRVMQESVNRYLKKYPNGIFELANAQQLTLQGDPAVALFPTQKPDYEVNSNAIFIRNTDKNTLLNANADSIRVGIIVSNLGKISAQKLFISLKRMYANGTVENFGKFGFNPISFQDTLYINVKNEKSLSTGNNRFEISLDPDNQILENRETNNSVVFEYNFPSANILILTPREFSIINQKEVNATLQIPTLGNNQPVVIEIDSSKNFNSTYRKTFQTTALSLWSLKFNLLEKDSTVYYLRTKFLNDNTWVESSFTYLKNGTEGFAQSTIPQLQKTTTDNQIVLDQTGWTFPQSSLKITAKIYGTNSVALPYRANFVNLNDKQLLGNGVCYPWSTFNAVAFNRALRPYSVLPSLVCGYTPYSVNYLSLEANTTDFQEYMSATTMGNYVMLWNSGYLEYTKLTPEYRQRFSEIGVDVNKINQMPNGAPFLVIGRKRAKKALLELFPDFNKNPLGEILSLDNYEIKDQFNEGTITSPLIGPANEWGNITLKINQDDTQKQSFSYEIVGINSQGNEDILFKDIRTNLFNISTIDAQKHPYLKLKLTVKTSEDFGKAPQLKSWMVTYKGVPEGVVNVKQSSNVTDKQEYENFTANVWFKNVSDKSFKDSVTVRQILTNRSQNRQNIKTFKVKPLNALDSVVVSIPVKTAGESGENTLSVTFNPQIQSEQIYNNNSIDYNFSVIPDKINPLLSVNFDGRQIQNNEIVSAKPQIQISVQDENLFRIRTDTVGIEIWLKNCKKCSFKRIYFKDPAIKWKANTQNNNFIINYLPQNLPEDTLTLQVQARDVAGNLAGSHPYQISFRIVQKQEVKSWKVFPNPFEAFTKFSFIVTGAEIPEEFLIEIFNSQGQPVSVIDNSGLNLRVGLNEFIWNGTDASGNKLPTGLYFYRVTVKQKGANLLLESGKVLKF